MAMIEAKTHVAKIASKLKRTVGAVHSRRSKLQRLARNNVPKAFDTGDIGIDGSS